MTPAHLKPSLCAFLDILGFSDHVMVSYRNGLQQNQLEQLEGILRVSSARLRDAHERLNMLTVRFFTDNLIIGYEFWTHDALHELSHLCELVADYQMELSCRGMFIRGGIARGTLATSDTMVFGDALIRAYELESRHASQPRVVLDPELKVSIERALNSASEVDRNTWRNRLLVDVDGYAYINYLSETFRPVARPVRILELDVDLLANHREHIMRRLNKCGNDPAHWFKFFWLANYHNAFCQRVRALDQQVDEQFLRMRPTEIGTPNQALDATSTPAPNADSSSHQG